MTGRTMRRVSRCNWDRVACIFDSWTLFPVTSRWRNAWEGRSWILESGKLIFLVWHYDILEHGEVLRIEGGQF
jgi:hypothetical protein